MSSDLSDFVYFHYKPSLPAAIVAIAVFLISTFLHGIQVIRHRTWFMIPVIIGGIFEAIGYGGRAVASLQTPNWTSMPYIIQTLFILIAPALIAASIYMWLGRIIVGLDGEGHSILRKKWLTKIFVTGDVISFLLQCGGGGLMTSKKASQQDLGQKVILGGLFFQLVIFGFFLIVAFIFHKRMRANPTRIARDASTKWQRHMLMLYFASQLIIARNGVRVLEFIQGYDGYIMSHEIYIYAADALLMAEVMLIYNFYHPSRFLRAIRGLGLDTEEGPIMELREPYQGYPTQIVESYDTTRQFK